MGGVRMSYRYLIAAAAFLIGQVASAEELIPIGVSSALTGEGATYGEDIKNVVLFANEKLGKGRFKIIVEDDRCNGRDAVTVAKKLVEIDKVRGVIGYGCSGAYLAAAPIFERAKVPAIGTEVSAAKISDAGDYLFRTAPSDAAGVRLLFNHLVKQHRTLGVLSAQTDFCQGIADDLGRIAKGSAMRLAVESVLSTDLDYKPSLLRLRSQRVDGLLLNAQDEAGAYRMLKQAKEVGLAGPYYTFYLGASATFLQLAGADAEGVITVDVPSLDEIATPEGQALFEEFTAKYGPMKAWSYGFATTFEAFRALTEAVLRSERPKDYLYETKFNGVFGPFSFDRRGDIVGLSLVLKRNLGGKAVAMK